MSHRKNLELCRIWKNVRDRNPKATDAECFQKTLDQYNDSYPNDEADLSDLIYALEHE